MSIQLDHFSFNKDFWIQLNERYISFGSDRLRYNSHFTISFNGKKGNLNFHVTKNAIDQKDKPKIGIVEISKQLLEEDKDLLVLNFINRLLKPIDIENLRLEHKNKIAFISLDRLQQEQNNSLLEKKMVDSFDGAFKVRKKSKLKFTGELASRLERFCETLSIEYWLIENLTEIPDNFDSAIESGIIVTENESITTLRINDKWFSINTELSLVDFTCIFVNYETAIRLKWKTKRAIISMRDAIKYSDTAHLDNPVILERNSAVCS